ncbi:LuxR C-terminal-related transcriptional regulator [Microbacterium sp. R86528]|uniref:helix-turn-helix transcriptional regulator n=1 Tax=Microbacterium sp. R86528 TaxID=3093864 RepID=UPI0037C60244
MNFNDSERARTELDRAIKSGDADKIARAAMDNIWPLYSDDGALLVEAVAGLPTAVLERFPALQLLHPMTPVLARTTQPFKPLVYPDRARAMTPDELDVTTLVQMVAFRISGDVAAAMIYAHRLSERVVHARKDSGGRADGPLWFYHQQIGSTLLAAGDSAGALMEFSTARQLGKFSKQPDAERLAQGRTALAHVLRGSLDAADTALKNARACAPATTAHIASALMSERTVDALIGVDRVSDDLEDRLAKLESYDSVELTWPFALLARARAAMHQQRPEDAYEAVRLASDAHPVQHGSYASDVIAAMSIKALLAMGDVPRARRIAELNGKSGLLTDLATARVALIEGNFTEAGARLRRLENDQRCGPAQRTEALLLAGWLEMASTATIDRESVLHIVRLAKNRDNRRLFGTMPRQLIECVHERLSGMAADDFAKATQHLANFELRARPTLTRSEQRVLNALAAYDTTAEIAAAFHVSPNTVKTQLKSLYRKLGCSTRDEAMKVGSRLHLVHGESELVRERV